MTEKDNDVLQEKMVDEELLTAFFAPSRHMQMADGGFTGRVMRRIPEAMPVRQRLAYSLWTLLCTAACLAVFFVTDGVALLKESFGSILGSVSAVVSQTVAKVDLSALLPVTMPDNAIYTVPLMVVGMLTLLGLMGLYGVMQSE